MRIAINLVVEMTDEQAGRYADVFGLTGENGKVRAHEVAEDVRTYVLGEVQDSPAFGEAGDGTRGADVSIKQRGA